MKDFFEEHGAEVLGWSSALVVTIAVAWLIVLTVVVATRGNPGVEILQNTMDGPVRNEVLWRNESAYFYHFEVGKATCVAFSLSGRSTMECDFAPRTETE